MSKFSFFLLPTLLASTSALAVDSCNGHPSCEEMGYSKADVPGCKEYLYCLYDHSYKVCLPDCGNSGNTPTTGSCPANYPLKYVGDEFDTVQDYLSLALQDELCPRDYYDNEKEISCCRQCKIGDSSKKDCDAKNGALIESTIYQGINTTCGECSICHGTIHQGMPGSNGEPTDNSKYCQYIDKNKQNPNKDLVCCSDMDCSCPNGTLLMPGTYTAGDGNAFKDADGEYCIVGTVTIKTKPTSFTKKYTFKAAQCTGNSANPQLNISGGMFESINSEVFTIINDGEAGDNINTTIHQLTLTKGGRLNTHIGADKGVIFNCPSHGCVYDLTKARWEVNDGDSTSFDDGYLGRASNVTCSTGQSSLLIKYSHIGKAGAYLFGIGCQGYQCERTIDGQSITGHIMEDGDCQ